MVGFRQLRYRVARSKLHAPAAWCRHRGLRHSDAWIASYPRSGSTWLRFLLYEILSGKPADFHSVNRDVAGVGRHATARALLPANGRLIQTHEPYRPEYGKAIYLVRDARDVVLSEYPFVTAQGVFPPDFEAFLDAFVRGRVNPFGSWQDNVNSWLDSPLHKTGRLLLIGFEELRRQTEHTLSRIVEFLGVSASPIALQQAIENNSLQRMREKEDRQPRFKAVVNAGERFVRSGSVGGWRGKLSESQVQLIELHCGTALSRLGYSIAYSTTATHSTPIPVLHPFPQRPVRQ